MPLCRASPAAPSLHPRAGHAKVTIRTGKSAAGAPPISTAAENGAARSEGRSTVDNLTTPEEKPIGTRPLTVSVLVPTYRRPDDLARCLTALTKQSLPPDQVVVVSRDTDAQTYPVIAMFAAPRLPLQSVTVSLPGQVHALNAGLHAVTGDIVAITDDDAAPWPDWIERIVGHFEADRNVGGVGGRDRMHLGGVLQDGRARVVGKIHRLGKHIGNHHLGYGEPREVDVLKGANMSYRAASIQGRRFDTRLRGAGAQLHNDLAFSYGLRCAGWKLIYDPAVVVDHFLALRFDEDQRGTFNPTALINAVFNETLIRLEPLAPFERVAYMLWAVGVGTRAAPGVVQWIRFGVRQPRLATAKLLAALRGRIEGASAVLTQPKR